MCHCHLDRHFVAENMHKRVRIATSPPGGGGGGAIRGLAFITMAAFIRIEVLRVTSQARDIPEVGHVEGLVK